jgi:hypothetical protein
MIFCGGQWNHGWNTGTEYLRWRFPLYWEITPRINNQVVSDFKRHIDRADHRFWNGTDKSARPSLFGISSDD